MPLNIGYVGIIKEDVDIRILHQTTGTVGPSQLLRDNAQGRCLEILNPSNRTGRFDLIKPDGTIIVIDLEPGTFGRSRSQMQTLGFQRRGDVGLGSVILDSPFPG